MLEERISESGLVRQAVGQSPTYVAGRYAPSAIEALIEQLLSCGSPQTRLVAKVVGGASVLAAFGESKEHLGLKNVAAALETLASYGIPVIGTDTGGTRGRKLVGITPTTR